MKNQILTELQANLDRFGKAKDPRNISVSSQEITSLFKKCLSTDKELLQDMTELFVKAKNKYVFAEWGAIELIVFDKVKSCLNLYIGTKEEALEYLSEGIHPPKVIFHLMQTHKIKTYEITAARKRITA